MGGVLQRDLPPGVVRALFRPLRRSHVRRGLRAGAWTRLGRTPLSGVQTAEVRRLFSFSVGGFPDFSGALKMPPAHTSVRVLMLRGFQDPATDRSFRTFL